MSIETDRALDEAADRVVDLAMVRALVGSRRDADDLRYEMQDHVDALVDACRAHYRDLYVPKDDDLSDTLARTLSGYASHVSSSAVCDELHGALFAALRRLLTPTEPADFHKE